MKIGKKYKLIPTEVKHNGLPLFRVEALKDFADVEKGDVGGYVHYESNLSHKGDCWIYDLAVVCDNAQVYDNAKVEGEAWVSGYAQVYGDAVVTEDDVINGYMQVYSKRRHAEKKEERV